MGGLFSSPKAPAPDPVQEQRVAQQEQRADAEQKDAKRKIQARSSARRTGGSRTLMAPGVYGSSETSERAVLTRSLGAGRNPRG
tara:strand:+ start:35 stop:286 length:252 start_codon:yes stop_codon:yes gene_type:complete